MLCRLSLLSQAILLSTALMSAALAKPTEPFDVVRAVRAIGLAQEAIAIGDLHALRLQRALLSRVARELEAIPRVGWQDTRRVLAAIRFMLSGGRPSFAKPELDAEVREDLRAVWQAARIYAQGNMAAARKAFEPLDAHQLDPTIAGQVALIKGLLAAASKPEQAAKLFDQARLLGVGTLVEEAAIRRQVALLARDATDNEFWRLADRYVRRYRRSAFAQAFRIHFAQGLVERSGAPKGLDQERLSSLLQRIEPKLRSNYCMVIAEHAVAAGDTVLGRLATAGLDPAHLDDGEMRSRARLYSAAIDVVDSKSAEVGAQLQNMNGLKEGSEEARLRAAVMAVFEEIHASAKTMSGEREATPAVTQANAKDEEPMRDELKRARAAVAAAEKVLAGSTPGRPVQAAETSEVKP